MSVTKTILESWKPETTQERKAVLLELECVLASAHFCNSKRYPALLRYAVERTLEGKAGSLKERTLGIEVFHRPADYDTNADTVVRYTAGEVRKRLSLYYHEHEPSSGFQISLPVGSYSPEFLKVHETDSSEASALAQADEDLPVVQEVRLSLADAQPFVPARRVIRGWQVAAVVVLLGLLGSGLWWRLGLSWQSATDRFWAQTLHGQATPLICVGGNVFDANKFSGTMTAGKDIAYPFVSMQLASAIARVGGLLERHGASYQIQASASTPLSDLRDRPVILLGGYNNLWTMRLLKPTRFQFSDEPFEGIVDRDHPGHRWGRDKSQPYASADDYALVARFRDQTTGSNVVVLAGLGRNGTEAAAQFATSAQYLQLIQARTEKYSTRANLEIVIKVSVIDGKTGAPSIEDVYTW